MYKKLLTWALGIIFHDVLDATKGQKLLNNHIEVIDVQEHSVTTIVDINDEYKYIVTTTRITNEKSVHMADTSQSAPIVVANPVDNTSTVSNAHLVTGIV